MRWSTPVKASLRSPGDERKIKQSHLEPVKQRGQRRGSGLYEKLLLSITIAQKHIRTLTNNTIRSTKQHQTLTGGVGHVAQTQVLPVDVQLHQVARGQHELEDQVDPVVRLHRRRHAQHLRRGGEMDVPQQEYTDEENSGKNRGSCLKSISPEA